MGSDCARIGFDRTRDYRSVVAQQGRVTLEADVNEQVLIASEALRLETIDVIGSCGTPDQSGYEVSIDSKGNLQIEPGIMYVGGWRMKLDKTVPLASQPGWLDQPPLTETKQGNSVVALLVTEQNISATEDQALLEVALGGPDTSARTRLMQHFVQWPTDATLCDAAEAGLRKTLKAAGLNWHPHSLALDFDASLEVSFFPPTTTADPCCPPAQGGYLGSDNQLVMVTVASFTAPSGTLLWGWNNASFLYRVTVVSPQVLQLDQAPVDNAHTPQPGQVIEIMQTTMVLGNPSDDNYVAAPQGLIVTLGTGTVYDTTTRQLTLPPGTTLPTDTDTLFVRLWQAEVPFTSGQTKQLDLVSGLAVTVKIDALPSVPLQTRPFWHFAVRPNTPQQVYPQRYTEGPQPADGPRQWLCDLAIVGPGPKEGWALVADCRKHFLPLTDASDCICCNLVLDPSTEWLSQLNVALAGESNALTICFQPGTFTVANKITFTNKVVKIIGAGQGTLITGPTLEAVLEFDNCPSVTLSDLSVAAGLAGFTSSNNTVGLQGAVTMRSCTQVDVERVTLSCADADLRSASCLAVYNAVPPATAAGPQYNVRVLNSQFKVGYCQVGILMVNADRAQIEGNLVYATQAQLNYKLGDLANHPLIISRLAKNLTHSMTITNTAPPTTKQAKARLLKKQRTAAGTTAVVSAAKAAPAQPAPAPAPPGAAPAPAGTTESVPAAGAAQAATVATKATNTIVNVAVTLPHVNLGLVGLAHINATFGTFQIQFVSSAKLTNAWTDAFRAAGLSATSTEGEIHSTIKQTALAVFKAPNTVSLAFRNYANAILPQLYSISSQGIVVAGNLANDIRILNNTIDGTAQGIHVGLSDMKTSPPSTDLAVKQVQICGNTVNVLLTPEMSGDRHGIYLGCATSALISDNQIALTRGANAGQDIYAIRVAGIFGPRILIERNCMQQFTYGIYAQPGNNPSSTANLWKAADNASTSPNWTASFRTTDNIP
jgi:hypothetical protein